MLFTNVDKTEMIFRRRTEGTLRENVGHLLKFLTRKLESVQNGHRVAEVLLRDLQDPSSLIPGELGAVDPLFHQRSGDLICLFLVKIGVKRHFGAARQESEARHPAKQQPKPRWSFFEKRTGDGQYLGDHLASL